MSAETEDHPGPDGTAAEQATWDLSDLIDLKAAGVEAPNGDGPAAVDALLDEADRRAAGFAEELEGKVGELDGPGLLDAMQRLARISDLAGRALNYAHLRFAADTEDPANGALLQRSSERATQIQTRLIFFELEWVAIDDERAEELLATDGLDFCRHHLRMERRYRPHLLTAPEERIVTELSLTGRGAWSRLFDELTSAIRVELPDSDEPVDARRSRSPASSIPIAIAGAPSPRRSPRRSSPACGPAPTPSTRCFRRRRRWIACAPTRTGSRPATSPTRPPTSPSQALVEAVRGRNDLARRWYRTKAKLLGIEPPRRLRPDGRRRRRRRADRLAGGSGRSSSRPSIRSPRG